MPGCRSAFSERCELARELVHLLLEAPCFFPLTPHHFRRRLVHEALVRKLLPRLIHLSTQALDLSLKPLTLADDVDDPLERKVQLGPVLQNRVGTHTVRRAVHLANIHSSESP